MTHKGTPEPTVTRWCNHCKKKTEQVRQGSWYLCLTCLWNADSGKEEKKDEHA